MDDGGGNDGGLESHLLIIEILIRGVARMCKIVLKILAKKEEALYHKCMRTKQIHL